MSITGKEVGLERPGPSGGEAIRTCTFVVVPAYNEARVIADVVAELRSQSWNVVVVDDGSRDGTAPRARAAGAAVLRHVVNRGQGAAIQTGFMFALAAGARCIVTFDADGQHRAEDIEALARPVWDGEVDVVLGSRFLGSAEDIPRGRRLLLSTAVLFTRFFSGARVTDTHNGLRAFSRAAASRVQLTQDGMAHASELLDQIVRAGLKYREVPVHVRYTTYSRAKGQRSSDSVRILFDYLMGRVLR